MPPSENTTTYRINGVPIDWDREKLTLFLEEKLSAKVDIMSLAHDLDDQLQKATAVFPNGLSELQSQQLDFIPIPSPQGSNSHLYRRQSLNIEKDFIGLTQLYAPPPEDYKVNIIALSGLGGHAFGSFKERKGRHMWLRDSLPHLLTSEPNKPFARVMTYGYDSTVPNSDNMQNLDDLANDFRTTLLALSHGPTIKPIIFIGHSLGGLIIKQTLIQLRKPTNEFNKRLIRAVYGVVFFGTPHEGMEIGSIVAMAGDGPNRQLVESLSRINSQVLTDLKRNFNKALGKKGDSEVFCFYEMRKSRTAKQNTNGEWTMDGPKEFLVTKSSATNGRPWEDDSQHICAIARTHSEMVKFGPHDHDLEKVVNTLKELSKRAIAARDQSRHQSRSQLPTSKATFLVPHSRNPDFVARSHITDEIAELFRLNLPQSSAPSRRRVSLYGLGGIGKTQIVLDFVYSLQETRPDMSVLWIHASNAERFRLSYATIAQEFKIPGYNDPKLNICLLVHDWLQRQVDLPWLMVLDNADDPSIFFRHNLEDNNPSADSQIEQDSARLARYIPDCNHGHILITTRNRQLGVNLGLAKRPIEVNELTDYEAKKLIDSLLDTEVPSKEVSFLSAKLAHLPLALAQAASYIQANQISIADYLKLLSESDSALVELLSGPFVTGGGDLDSSATHAVAKTWIISFKQIEDEAPLASYLLSFLSLFHFQTIPKLFAEQYFKHFSERSQGRRSKRSKYSSRAAALAKPFCFLNQPHFTSEETESGEAEFETRDTITITEAIGTLKAYSFVSEGTGQSISMHRLVQLVMREWLVTHSRMAEFVRSAVTILSKNFPYGIFEYLETCTKYLPHALSVLDSGRMKPGDKSEDKAQLLHNLAWYFYTNGELKMAEIQGTQALEIRKKVLGRKHPDTLSSLSNLAVIHLEQGRHKEAAKQELQVLKLRRRVLGEENQDTLMSKHNIALIYLRQGWHEKAMQQGLSVVESRTSVLGERHPDTLLSKNNLLITYLERGWPEAAEQIWSELLEVQKEVLGEEHRDTLRSFRNLASAYSGQGRHKEAEELGLHVLKLQKKVLGEEHPDTLISMSNLTLAYSGQECHEEAKQLGSHVLEVQKRVLGEEHPDTLRSISNLAFIYLQQGIHGEAEKLGVQVVDVQRRVLGERHPDTLMSMNHLASTLKSLGRLSEAIALMRECVSSSKKTYGPHSSVTEKRSSTLKSWKESV